jgi:RES domain-containing protein
LIVTAWRIVKKRHVSNAFDGEGARVNGGRWNSVGVPAVYTAGSISLAMLEMLVHEEPPLVSSYGVIPVKFDDALVENLKVSSLPRNWNAYPAPAAVVRIGDDWLRSRRGAVLRVPSAIVASESNYLLNPVHKGFSAIVIGDPENLPIDSRLAR